MAVAEAFVPGGVQRRGFARVGGARKVFTGEIASAARHFEGAAAAMFWEVWPHGRWGERSSARLWRTGAQRCASATSQ